MNEGGPDVFFFCIYSKLCFWFVHRLRFQKLNYFHSSSCLLFVLQDYHCNLVNILGSFQTENRTFLDPNFI